MSKTRIYSSTMDKLIELDKTTIFIKDIEVRTPQLYLRKGIYPLDLIFKRMEKCGFTSDIIDEYKINLDSIRMRLFYEERNNLVCSVCSIKGLFFAMERTIGQPNYHLNLYAIEEVENKEVLMTKDHILPKSKGGKDNISNMQVMCSHCNWGRSNKSSHGLVQPSLF